MRRRRFLQSSAVLASLPVGVVAAHRDDAATTANETTTTTTTDVTTTATTPTTTAVATPTTGLSPVGSLDVDTPRETVVSSDGSVAFVATTDGFATVDLTDPETPELLARETDISPPGTDRTLQDVFDVKYDDGELLVVGPANYDDDGFYGLALYDVSDPASPEFLRAHETTFAIHNCYLQDGYAYLTSDSRPDNPLVIVDVRGEPRVVSRWSLLDHDDAWADVDTSLRPLHDVWVQGDLAYLAYWDAGTWILDVSTPENPEYVANITERSPADLADLASLKQFRERTEPPGNVHYVATDETGTLLGVGGESWNSNAGEDENRPGPDDPGGPSGIDLYDVSDPASPEKLSTIDPPPTADPNYGGVWTTAHNFDIHDGYLYSSWYQGGVRVHDLTDPANPRELRAFRQTQETSFWTAQMAVPGDFFVATSFRDPWNPDRPGAVYTFPDPADRATPTPTPTDSPTASPTPDPTPTDTATVEQPTQDTPTATTTNGPGFGAVAALAGLGAGAWRLLQSDDTDEN